MQNSKTVLVSMTESGLSMPTYLFYNFLCIFLTTSFLACSQKKKSKEVVERKYSELCRDDTQMSLATASVMPT